MAYDFQRLSSVDEVTEVSEEVNILIEDGDGVKRAKKDLVGGMPAPVGYENGTALIAVDGAWKQQTGYAYAEHVAGNVTWDGDTDGRPVVSASGYNLYKVSDLTPDTNHLVGGTFRMHGYEDQEILENYISAFDENLYVVSDLVIAVCKQDNYTAETPMGTVTVPEKGIYFIEYDSEDGTEYTESLVYEKNNVTKFSPELIESAPKITLTYSQIIQEDPEIVVQLTEEQGAIVSNNAVVYLDCMSLGMGSVTVMTAKSGEGITLVGFYGGNGASIYNFFYDEETMQATFYGSATVVTAGNLIQEESELNNAYRAPSGALVKTIIDERVPAYTGADEGKVLKIVDGVATWVAE